MTDIKLYRKRYIPDELVYLKDDEILVFDDERIITRWEVLKPRKDFCCGLSCYFLKDGFKISKFLDKDGKIVYWYCDIIDYEVNGKEYIFKDLLIDVIVYENGFVKVVDLDETAKALRENILEKEVIAKSIERVSNLLNIIYDGHFEEYKKFLDVI